MLTKSFRCCLLCIETPKTRDVPSGPFKQALSRQERHFANIIILQHSQKEPVLLLNFMSLMAKYRHADIQRIKIQS